VAQGHIENPVINSPFVEPGRHFRVEDGQVTGAIDERRRPSAFFVPVAKLRKAAPQLALQRVEGAISFLHAVLQD